MVKKYRLALEIVTGTDDNEDTEIFASWWLGRGDNKWSFTTALLKSIKEAYDEAKAGR